MSLSGSLPYGIVRLVLRDEGANIGLWSVIFAAVNVLALLYWCLPAHRRGGRL